MSTNKSFAIYQKVRLGISGTEPGRLFNSTDAYQDLTGELGVTRSGVANQGTLGAIRPIAPSLPALLASRSFLPKLFISIISTCYKEKGPSHRYRP